MIAGWLLLTRLPQDVPVFRTALERASGVVAILRNSSPSPTLRARRRAPLSFRVPRGTRRSRPRTTSCQPADTDSSPAAQNDRVDGSE